LKHLVLTILQVSVIASDAEKMASILNQIVENEGTHDLLQGPFLYMEVVCTRQHIEDSLFPGLCFGSFVGPSDY
jgi:hypothetical protein